MIVWCLFDSGEGAYQRAINKYFSGELESYSLGIDIEQRGHNFIEVDLADYKALFGDNTLFDTLDKLPKPDIILASPPCESWSVASAMKGGNVSYIWDTGEMVMRTDTDMTKNNDHSRFKRIPWKVMYRRVNGELCAYNTVRIIQRYQPQYWVIENPYSSHIWYYLEHYHDFKGYLNQAHYGAYSEAFPKKPTGFMSNVQLTLKKMAKGTKAKVTIGKDDANRKQICGYNKRSDIPDELIKDILDQLINKNK